MSDSTERPDPPRVPRDTDAHRDAAQDTTPDPRDAANGSPRVQPDEIAGWLDDMVVAIRRRLQQQGLERLVIVGVHTGGVWIARELQQRLGPDLVDDIGRLDISFYRDDFSRIGMHPQVRPSILPEDIDDAHVLLVDDVLYTGRTIRAALNEIFDYGRPASVTLAVLVQRNGRELPIGADIVGQTLQLAAGEQIKLRGPTPLWLETVRPTADSPA